MALELHLWLLIFNIYFSAVLRNLLIYLLSTYGSSSVHLLFHIGYQLLGLYVIYELTICISPFTFISPSLPSSALSGFLSLTSLWHHSDALHLALSHPSVCRFSPPQPFTPYPTQRFLIKNTSTINQSITLGIHRGTNGLTYPMAPFPAVTPHQSSYRIPSNTE